MDVVAEVRKAIQDLVSPELKAINTDITAAASALKQRADAVERLLEENHQLATAHFDRIHSKILEK